MDLTLMKEIIQKTNKLALSTSYNDQADVRIVNFVSQEETPGKLYFSSVKTGPALKVYAKNPDVAFITIPDDGASGNPYLKATHVKIKKSPKTTPELLPLYLQTVPNYQQVWDAIGPTLTVFELISEQIYVDAGLGQKKETLQF